MNQEFWKLPEELEAEREQTYNEFQALFNEKVERVNRNFERELTDKQTELNLQDEKLLLATQQFLNLLLVQIDRLTKQNTALQRNLMESIDHERKLIESDAYKAKFIEVVNKHKVLLGI